jgi:hypothetical protein
MAIDGNPTILKNFLQISHLEIHHSRTIYKINWNKHMVPLPPAISTTQGKFVMR